MRRASSSLICLCFLVSCFGALTGCGWIHSKQIAKRTNPKYRSAEIPGPTRLLPISTCKRSRRGVIASEADRKRLLDDVVPALWRAAGGSGEPAIGTAPTPVFCQELYESDTYPPWEGNAKLRDAVRSLLGDGERSLLAMFVSPTYSCQEKTRTVRDADGGLVGTIGTGDEVCAENGHAHVLAYLFSADGEIIWQAGADVDLLEDAARIASTLFEGFPRERVTIAVP